MTKITIPPAALEAGARFLFKEEYPEANITWDDLNRYERKAYGEAARAAFEAMVAAWPGAEQLGESSIMISGAEVDIPARINLPLSGDK